MPDSTETIYIEIHDISTLKSILEHLLDETKTFFHFRRIEDLTDEDELKVLKNEILLEFSLYGKYDVIKEFNERVFDSIGILDDPERVLKKIIDLWRCFYSISLFQMNEEKEYVDYLDFIKAIVDSGGDLYGIKHIDAGLCDFIIMKGLGMEEVFISCKREIANDLLQKLSQIESIKPILLEKQETIFKRMFSKLKWW